MRAMTCGPPSLVISRKRLSSCQLRQVARIEAGQDEIDGSLAIKILDDMEFAGQHAEFFKDLRAPGAQLVLECAPAREPGEHLA